MFDTIVYFTTLVLSIILGSHYKSIENLEVKKNYGAGLGVLISFMICGHYLYHTILMVWLNIIILRNCEKRYVHIVSLAYTWTHLVFLHFFLPDAHFVFMLHQNIALRLVGLAFEMYTASVKSSKENETMKSPLTKAEAPSNNNSDETQYVLESSSADMLSYAFFFIGLHQGPYFKYKVYIEHLRVPFGTLGDFRELTETKIKKAFIYVIAYLVMSMKFSTKIYMDQSLYELDAEMRYLYNIPFLCMFVLRSVIVTLLCTCVCTEAGFGVYPMSTQPVPGHGPTARPSLLNLTQEQALMQQYNFSMLKCFKYKKLILGPRMIDTVRSWDMPTGYWFLVNIHRKLFKGSKEVRSAWSFLAWAVWNGASLQAFIISITLWIYIHVELMYGELYNTTGQLAWDIGFSIMRMFCLIYLTPCLAILDVSTVVKYYNSIFWIFHMILIVLIVGVVVARHSRAHD